MDQPNPETGHAEAEQLGLHPELAKALRAAAEPRRVMRGDVLMEQGSKADALFFVLSGRFTVIVNGAAIAEIGSGEPIGEVAFLGGGTRSATVVAARSSEVLVLTQEAYDQVLDRQPALGSAIISALANRLRTAVSKTPQMRPRPANVIGILPGGNATLDLTALAPLLAGLNQTGAPVLTSAADLGSEGSVADLALHADAGERLVLTCANPKEDPAWADEVFQNCETIIVCVDRRTATAGSIGPLESRIADSVLRQNTHLVLLREPGTERTGSAAWLDGRSFGLHHHMEAGSQADAARITRLIDGEGLGVVFGGGGAFGTAHLAMLKAFGAHGIEFDMVGGTSVGAAMAGAFAMGLSMDEVIDRFVEMFVTSGAATKFTLPFWSIMDHKPFDAQLQHHYGADRMAEDLSINFFALATSLSQNAPVVLRRGKLWEMVRASGSIPAVFPPYVMEDGEVLVDGGLFNNVPVDTMRSLKGGPNLVLRLEPKTDWRVDMDYAKLPGRGGAFKRAIFGRRAGKVRFPSTSSVMTRSLIVNSENLQANIDREQDIFIDLQRIKGMGFMQWQKGRDLFDKTYQETSERLDKLAAQHSGLDLLRALAQTP